MIKSSLRAVIAAAACACMLAGCDDAPPEAQNPGSTTNKKAVVPKVGEVAPDMVAAVSAGKGSTAIGVHFALRAPPTVNKPLPIDVAIVPHREFAMVRVRFEGRDGLVTASGEDFGPKTAVKSETVLSHQIVLLPSKEGIAMITASVESEGDDGNVVRIYSIPVIVSAADPKTNAPAAN